MIDKTKYREQFVIPASSGLPDMETMEKKADNKRKLKHKIIVMAVSAFAAAFVLSNGICLAAAGETWIRILYDHTFNSGNGAATVQIYHDDGGAGTIVLAGDGSGYSIYENGRTYFIFGDIKEDITEDIAGGNYYLYEYTDDSDVMHRIFVGEGAFDNENNYCSSWMEQFLIPDGQGHATAQSGPVSWPEWLVKAMQDYPLYHVDEIENEEAAEAETVEANSKQENMIFQGTYIVGRDIIRGSYLITNTFEDDFIYFVYDSVENYNPADVYYGLIQQGSCTPGNTVYISLDNGQVLYISQGAGVCTDMAEIKPSWAP